MKKFYVIGHLPFFCLLTLLGFNSTFAQVSFGIKGGTNFSTRVIGDQTKNYHFGIYAGLSARMELGKKIYVSSDILFSQKGNKIGPTFADGPDYNLYYLSLPVLIGYKIEYRLSVLFGGEVSYILGENVSNEPWTTSGLEKIDIGLAGGVSYLLSKRLDMQFRYVYGLSPVAVAYQSYTYNGILFTIGPTDRRDRGLNRVFQLGLSYEIF